jgi:hypothetical protein
MVEEERYDAGEEKVVRNRKSKAQKARERYLVGVNESLNNYDVRQFTWTILSHCGLFDAAPYGEEAIRFNGKRDVGLWLMMEMNDIAKMTGTNWFQKMQSEAIARDAGDK